MIRFSLHYFLLFALMATVFPYLQLLLRARGFSDAQVGYLQGLNALAGVCGPLLLGYLADRFGKRRSMLVGCLLLLAAFLVPLGAVERLWVAAVLVVGMGFVWKSTIPLTDTLASHELPDPARQYGRVRIWGSIGFVATLLIVRAGHLIDEASAASMTRYMLAAAGLCVVSALALPDRYGPANRRAAGTRDGGMGAIFWVFLLAASTHQFGMISHYSFFSLYLQDALQMKNAAWVWAIGSAAEVPVLFFAGRIIPRAGLAAMLIASMAVVSVRLALYAVAPALWVVLPAQLLHSAAFGLFHSASIEFIRRRVPLGRRGVAMAAYMSLAIGVPAWIGSSLGGVILQRWGYSALYGAYAFVPLIGIACVALARASINRPAESGDATP